MKRHHYFILIVICLLVVSIIISNRRGPDYQAILPNIEPYSQLKSLDPSRLENNLFIGFIGFTYPHDNYLEVAKSVIANNHQYLIEQHKQNAPVDFNHLDHMDKYLLENEERLKVIETSADDSFKSIESILPCFFAKGEDIDCIESILKNRDAIKRRIALNGRVIHRYEEIFEESDYYATIFYPYGEYNTLLDDNAHLIKEISKLSSLRLAEAVLMIDEGAFERGMAQLNSEESNLRLFLGDRPTAPSLLVMMVVKTRVERFSQFLEDLLDSGLLDQHLNDPAVAALFEPLSETEKNAIKRALKNSIKELTMPSLYPYLLSTMDNWEETRSPNEIQLSYAEREIAFDWLERRLGRDILGVSYNGKRTTNQFKLSRKEEEEELGRLRKAIREDHPLEQPERYFSEKGITFIDLIHFFDINISSLHVNEHYQYLTDYSEELIRNPYGDALKLLEARGKQMGDLYNYTRYYKMILAMDGAIHLNQLVILKYRAKAENIERDKISDWLKTESILSTNRINGESFKWDFTSGKLSTEYFSSRKGNRKKELSVQLFPPS